VTLWNVRLAIVDLVAADSAEAAIAKLRAAVEAAGFDVYDDVGHSPDAFESEPEVAS